MLTKMLCFLLLCESEAAPPPAPVQRTVNIVDVIEVDPKDEQGLKGCYTFALASDPTNRLVDCSGNVN